jgi:hypothetical protein
MTLLNKIIDQIYDNIDFFKIGIPIDLERYKKFTELSVFVEYLNKVSAKVDHPNLEAINKFIFSELNSIDSDIIFNNSYLPYHIIFPYFSIRNKYPIKRYENYLSITAKYKLFPPEIPPHREMEWSHFCLKLNLINNFKAPKNCILNQDNYLANFNRDLSYSFTHALFYIYDFGFANSKPLISNFASIKFQTECLIFKSFEEDDIDILLELFINYFGFYRFHSINLELLDVLDYSILSNQFLNFNWKAENNIDKMYHSNLVLGILCCLFIEMSNSKYISLSKKTKLDRKVKNSSVFGPPSKSNLEIGSDNFNLPEFKEYTTWKLIMKSTRKDFAVDDITSFQTKYKLCRHLSMHILRNVNLSNERNKLNILFESEFTRLNLSHYNQDSIRDEYSVLLNGIKRNVCANAQHIRSHRSL